MRMLPLLSCAAVVALVGTANRAEAQFMYGGGLRYAPGVGYQGGMGYPVGGSVVSVRGPLGGRLTVAQGPFGGGAVNVRGPFGGRINTVRPAVLPAYPPAIVSPPVYVPQTVLNPAIGPTTNLNWPYSAAYMARIPPGTATLEIGGAPYFYTQFLPLGSQPATVGGVNYFVSNGIFYQPYFLGGQTVYVIVER